jgi:hypothetical protein
MAQVPGPQFNSQYSTGGPFREPPSMGALGKEAGWAAFSQPGVAQSYHWWSSGCTGPYSRALALVDVKTRTVQPRSYVLTPGARGLLLSSVIWTRGLTSLCLFPGL